MSLISACSSLATVFDLKAKEAKIQILEKEASQPEFWQQPDAEMKIRQLVQERKEIEGLKALEKSIADLREVAPLAEAEADFEVEVEKGIADFASRLEAEELRRFFREKYDSRPAILALHAGAGGTEAQDWAAMLLRMYLRWAEAKGFKAEVLELNPGEEVGVKNALVEVSGSHAYGLLKAEHGVHRLVRLSPFDSAHARHTSFVLIEVMPQAEGNVDITINPDDLEIEAFRASGPGGQHMQKSSTAVRITHIPSGIAVSYQGERSQYQNKETAMKILRARLLERELKVQAEERARIKGKPISAGWGNQIRSYVLHPYKMVKDHRTDYETGDAQAVLDGKLDEFIRAYMEYKLAEG